MKTYKQIKQRIDFLVSINSKLKEDYMEILSPYQLGWWRALSWVIDDEDWDTEPKEE